MGTKQPRGAGQTGVPRAQIVWWHIQRRFVYQEAVTGPSQMRTSVSDSSLSLFPVRARVNQSPCARRVADPRAHLSGAGRLAAPTQFASKLQDSCIL